MSTVTLVSSKGGVGKTTLALNLAFAFARRGWSTVLIDADPQGGIGNSISGDTDGSGGLAAFLANPGKVDDLVIRSRLPELSILPFGHATATAAAQLASRAADGTLLKLLIDDFRERYQLVVVDTPAGFGGLTVGAVRASTHLVVPLQAEPLALRSLSELMELVAEVRESGSPVRVAGVVPTMVQTRQDVSLAATQEAYRLLPADVILESFVPRDPIFLEASAKGVPLGLLGRRPPPLATVFERIAAELEPRLGIIVEEASYEPIPLLD